MIENNLHFLEYELLHNSDTAIHPLLIKAINQSYDVQSVNRLLRVACEQQRSRLKSTLVAYNSDSSNTIPITHTNLSNIVAQHTEIGSEVSNSPSLAHYLAHQLHHEVLSDICLYIHIKLESLFVESLSLGHSLSDAQEQASLNTFTALYELLPKRHQAAVEHKLHTNKRLYEAESVFVGPRTQLEHSLRHYVALIAMWLILAKVTLGLLEQLLSNQPTQPVCHE